MPFNGSGTYSLPGAALVTGGTVDATEHNSFRNDVATALTDCVTRDGQSPATANLPMGGFKHTGVANATARTDYAVMGQVQDSSITYLTTVAGTDTITASLTGLAAYAAGQVFRFAVAGANTTTAVTLNINALGAKSITKLGATALAVGDIAAGTVITVVYDGANFQLQSPYYSSHLSVSASVAANALTVGLNPCTLEFRNATLTNGVPNTRVVGTALSLVVPSGATLGTTAAVAARLMLLAIDNAGTVELAIVNQAGGLNMDGTGLVSTTAISVGATSASTIYSTMARTSVPYRVVGFVDITEATAGTWATAPTVVQGYGGTAIASGNFAASLSANGYQKLPNGLIMQWGTATGSNLADVAVTFPLAFPNACQSIQASMVNGGGSGPILVSIGPKTLTTFNFGTWTSNTAARVTASMLWFAIGY